MSCKAIAATTATMNETMNDGMYGIDDYGRAQKNFCATMEKKDVKSLTN
jgi:hypothetical protein